MTDTPDINLAETGGDDILAAELSLGILEGEERSQAERRARTDMGFAQRVEEWDARFVQLTRNIPPVAPPPGLFDAIAARAYPESPRRLWQKLGIVPAFLGAAAAALVLILTMNFGGLMLDRDPTATLTARVAAEDDSLVIAAAYVADDGELYVELQAGQRGTDRDLELWLIAGEDAPVSLGVLSPQDGIERISVPTDLRDRLPGAVLAISDEPAGGSPTGAPTGAVLAVGEMTAL